MAKTRAQENKAIRQEALRAQLEAQGHLQHITDLTAKLEEPGNELDALATNKLKIVIDTKLKLINKYLPDLKSTEISGELNMPQVIRKDLSGE